MRCHLQAFPWVVALPLLASCTEGKSSTARIDPAPTAAATSRVAPASSAAPRTLAEGKFGNAILKGVVTFSGKVPEMMVPKKRKDAELCKDKDVKSDAVVVTKGKLKDTLVRIAPDAFKASYPAPAKHAEIDQIDCVYRPRLQGVVAGQGIDIKNSDGVLHNVHSYQGRATWFNIPQPKGASPLAKEAPEDTKVLKFACDIHPWMRAFVVVSPHPFFAVTGTDGVYQIEKIPPGDYTIEAWSPTYGLKTGKAKLEDGKTAEIGFTYDGTEPPPDENRDELIGL